MPRAGDAIGPYVLVKRLGQGSFGEVWLAEKRSAIAATKFALKIPLDEHPDVEKIRREAVVWEKAKGHPNVLPIIEADIYDGTVLIVSEYAEEGSLEDALRRHGGRAPDQATAVRWMDGMLAGLAHLHGKGIVHRDLKPGNILMQGGIPRITDFGLSRVLKTSAHSGTVSGTLHYMSPEAFEGERTAASDLWAAGVILYRLVSGSYPYPYDDMARLMKAILMKPPEPLPEEVPESLRSVVGRALEREASKRYPDATAMREALARAGGNGFPPSARVGETAPVRDGSAGASEPSDPDRTGGGTIREEDSGPPTRFDAAYASTVVSVAGPRGTRLFPDGEGTGEGETTVPPPTPQNLVKCPLCGKKNDPRETFECRECKTDDLCLEHRDPVHMVCRPCREKQAGEAERKAAREKSEAEEKKAAEEARAREEKRKAEAARAAVTPPASAAPVAVAARRPPASPSGSFPLLWALALVGVVAVIVTIVLVSQGNRGGAPTADTPSSGGAPPQSGTTSAEGLGLRFVHVPAGSFPMGSNSSEAFDNEKPTHTVTISKPFELQTTEVTQAQWQAVMGGNPSNFKGDELPVEQVSWNDCQEFIRKLNQLDPGKGYRLPTEAEWEYACRAGTTGDRYGDLNSIAWYTENSGGKTHPVVQKQPNAWGLYDTLGNVWEWCEDWYGDYPSGAVTDPTGPASGSFRVYRGGGWFGDARSCRAAYRFDLDPGLRGAFLGFRLARSAR